MRLFLADVVVFVVRNIFPIAAFGLAVYLAASLLLPTTHPRAWKILAFLCVAWLVADKVLSKGGGA